MQKILLFLSLGLNLLFIAALKTPVVQGEKMVVLKRVVGDYGDGGIQIVGTHEKRFIPAGLGEEWGVPKRDVTMWLKAEDGSVVAVTEEEYAAIELGERYSSDQWRHDPY